MTVLSVAADATPSGALAESIAAYDRGAAQFAEQYESISPDRYLDWLVAALEPGALVLDAGCGSGRDTAALRARGIQALGIDRSSGMLSEARRRHPACDFVCGDL